MAYTEHPPEKRRETGLETRSDFDDSVTRLFQLADSKEGGEVPMFFKVGWDAQQPGKITDVTTMVAFPTGARRQEYKGRFNQAQFRIIEASDTGEDEKQRFIWVRTGLRSPDSPIEPNPETIADDFGYYELEPYSVAHMLAGRVDSIKDYARLAEEIGHRQLPIPPELKDRAIQLLHHFARGDTLTLNITRDAIPEFARLLDGVSPTHAGRIRSLVLADLLRAITGNSVKRRNALVFEKDEAVGVLEAALREGMIPSQSPYIDWILTKHSVYQYPFATELLYATLQRKRHPAKSTRIFSVERMEFACNYIATILAARAPNRYENTDLGYPLETFLNPELARTDDIPQVYYLEYLIQLAGFLRGEEELLQSGAHSSDSQDDPINLQGAGQAFLAVLQELRNVDPEIADKERRLDEMHGEIVDMVLKPIVHRKFGRQTLKVSQADNEPSEAISSEQE